MNKEEINKIVSKIETTKERNIVIIDFANVVCWQNSLKWEVGIKELKSLIKHFSCGKKFLRRFYYGSDYESMGKSDILTPWSELVFAKARLNDFEICTKRVKYITDKNRRDGYMKKSDLDVEMAVDLIKEKDNYDNIILFSGDGDLAYVLRYLKTEYNKSAYVFAARNYLGAEIVDCYLEKIVSRLLFAEDFEHRLNRHRFRI